MTKIHRRICATVSSMALLSVGAVGAASAQEGGMSADSVGSESSVEAGYQTGEGFKISDDLTLHPKLDLEAGYQANVFYQDDGDAPSGPIGAPLLRVGVGAGLSTAGTATPGENRKLVLSGDVGLFWNQYISDNSNITAQSDLGINALVGLQANPDGALTFEVRDGFTRAVNPPPAESSDDVDRDKNELTVGLIGKPGGGALQIYGNATWTLDVFERSAISFSNRNSVIGALGSKWQWLPKTQLNGEVSFGAIFYDAGALKVDRDTSTPLRITVGTSTLITPNFGTVLRVGYGNGFYTGANFNSYLLLAELRYAFGPTLRLAGGYSHDFADALIGNFREDHMLYARFAAQLAGRVQLNAKGELRFRSYEGVPANDGRGTSFCSGPPPSCTSSDRTDTVFRLDAGLDFLVNEWLVLGGHYMLISDSTDAFTTNTAGSSPDSDGFVWHEIMAKATAKF